MVVGISNIFDLTRDLSKVEDETSSSYLKILPNDLRNKMRIIENPNQKKIQFCVIPDREIPVKVIIRGLPTSTDIEELKLS